MATTRKKPAPVEVHKQLELFEAEGIRVIFDGQGNRTVSCSINGVGYTYPADEAVLVEQHVADAIGRYRLA